MRRKILAAVATVVVAAALGGCAAGLDSNGVMATIRTPDGKRVDFAAVAELSGRELRAEDPLTGWRLTIALPAAPGRYLLGGDDAASAVEARWSATDDARATAGTLEVTALGTRHGELISGTLMDVSLSSSAGQEVGVVAAATFRAVVP
jgi:hypothetical protein